MVSEEIVAGLFVDFGIDGTETDFEAMGFDVRLKALNMLVEEMLSLNCSLVPCGFIAGISVFGTPGTLMIGYICLL